MTETKILIANPNLTIDKKDAITIGDTVLYRLVAKTSFETFYGDTIEAKTKGGYVESLDYIFDASWVGDNAKLYDGAALYGGSVLSDNSVVKGDIELYESELHDNSEIIGSGKLLNVEMFDNSKIRLKVDRNDFSKDFIIESINGLQMYDNSILIGQKNIYVREVSLRGGTIVKNCSLADSILINTQIENLRIVNGNIIGNQSLFVFIPYMSGNSNESLLAEEQCHSPNVCIYPGKEGRMMISDTYHDNYLDVATNKFGMYNVTFEALKSLANTLLP